MSNPLEQDDEELKYLAKLYGENSLEYQDALRKKKEKRRIKWPFLKQGNGGKESGNDRDFSHHNEPDENDI